MIQRGRNYLNQPGLGPALIKAVAGSAGLRILGMGFGFLVGVQLARALGAEGYGIYGLALSIIMLIGVLPEFGISALVTREVASSQVRADWSQMRGILHWSGRTVALMSVSAALLLAAWLIWIRPEKTELHAPLLAGLALLPLLSLGRQQSAALRGLQHIVAGQLPQELFRPALFSLLLLLYSIFSVVGLSTTWAIGLHAIAAAASLLLAMLLLQRKLPPEVRQVQPMVATSSYWSSAWPMALTEGARLLQAHLVILVLALFVTFGSVGIYRVAASIYVMTMMPVSLLNVVSMPVISRLYAENDRIRLQRMLSWLAVLMMLGVLALSLPFILFGESLLSVIFGAEFAESNKPLMVLCAGAIFSASFGANAALLNMTGHEKRVTRGFLLSLVVLCIASLVLIPRMGVLGAALATAMSLIAWNLLIWHDARQRLGLDTSIFWALWKRDNDAR